MALCCWIFNAAYAHSLWFALRDAKSAECLSSSLNLITAFRFHHHGVLSSSKYYETNLWLTSLELNRSQSYCRRIIQWLDQRCPDNTREASSIATYWTFDSSSSEAWYKATLIIPVVGHYRLEPPDFSFSRRTNGIPRSYK